MPNEIVVFGKTAAFPNTKHMKGPNYSFNVKLDLDKMPPKMLKDLEKDPLFHAQVSQKVVAIHDDMVKDVGNFMQKFEKEIEKGVSSEKEIKEFQEQINRVVDQIVDESQKEAEKSVKTGWEALRKKKDDYKNYTGKVKATIAMKSTFLVGGIAITAVSSPTGVGLVLGIAGLIKSAVDLGKVIVKAAVEAETLLTNLKKNLASLKNAYGKSKAKLVAGEAFKSTFNAFILPIMNTISECKDDLEQSGKKILGVEVNAHKLAKGLQKVLQDIDKLQAECKTFPKALKNIAPLEKKVMTFIPEIQKLCQRVDALEAELKPLAVQLKALEEQKPEALGYLETGLKFADALVSAVQGDAEGVVVALMQVDGEFMVDKIFEE